MEMRASQVIKGALGGGGNKKKKMKMKKKKGEERGHLQVLTMNGWVGSGPIFW